MNINKHAYRHTYTHTEQASMHKHKHTHKYACETHGVDLQKKNFLQKTHASTHSPNTHIQT